MSDATIIDFGKSEFVHLGLGASTIPLPTHTGEMEWYQQYGEAHGSDGNEGRLVSVHTFTESWDTWEMHPAGTELVLCLSGEVTLIQELTDGTVRSVSLGPQQAVVNDPGVWHTADVVEGQKPTVLFITAGAGTEIRPR